MPFNSLSSIVQTSNLQFVGMIENSTTRRSDGSQKQVLGCELMIKMVNSQMLTPRSQHNELDI